MLWFTSTLPTETLDDSIGHLADAASGLELRVTGEAVYGPPDVVVGEIELSSQLKTLHMELFNLLNNFQVAYDKPQFVGAGYSPHVSHQGSVNPSAGDVLNCKSMFLVSTEGSSHKGPRTVIGKYALGDT